MLTQLIAKYKKLIDEPKIENIYILDNLLYSKKLMPLEDLMILIENDIVDPTKITNITNNLFSSNYFHNYYQNKNNKTLINFIDLLIKKGLDINKTINGNIPILNKYNSEFISRNLKVLINKFKLNINYTKSSKKEYKLFPEIFNTIFDNTNETEIQKLLPVCLNLIQNLSEYQDEKIHLLLYRNSLIKDNQLRLNNLKKMIELGLDLNKSCCSGLYSKIKTIDEFLFLKRKGYSLNENENAFIFPFLLNDFEKNLPIIENIFPQLESSKKYKNKSFIELLLNNKNEKLTIKNNLNDCYLLFLLKKLVSTFSSSQEILDYLSKSNNKTPISITEQKILNNLDLIKNKYHIDLSKTYFHVNNLIHNIDDLKLFLMYGCNVDFLKPLKINFDYKKIIEYKIPEIICNNNLKEFNDRFFNGEATQFFFLKKGRKKEIPNIINDYEYLKLYIDTYGLKLKDATLWETIKSIKTKKIFNLIAKSYREQLANLLNENIDKLHCLTLKSQLIMLDFIKNNLDKNAIKTFIIDTLSKNYQSSFTFLKNLCSTFGEDEIENILKNENIDFTIPALKNKEFEYFELLNKLGGIKTNINYFDEMISDKFLTTPSLNSPFYTKKIKKYDHSYKEYLAIKKEHLINILNKSPNKTCYCNKSLFKATYQECMDEVINELKINYPNFDVNKCDDYGYTIKDYLINNYFLYYKFQYRIKFNKIYLSEFIYYLLNDEIFIKNLTTLVKNGYVVKNNLLKELKKFNKRTVPIPRKDGGYSMLMSNIEKTNLTDQFKIPKINKGKGKYNLNKMKNSLA